MQLTQRCSSNGSQKYINEEKCTVLFNCRTNGILKNADLCRTERLLNFFYNLIPIGSFNEYQAEVSPVPA